MTSSSTLANKPPTWSRVNALILTLSVWFIWNFWLNLFFTTSYYLYSTQVSDFLANFYTAGSSWLAGSNPYANTQIVFPYTPASLPFFGFFALFDQQTAARFWTLTYLSMFVIAFLALAFTIKTERRKLFVCLTVLLFFSSFPLLWLVELSQSDLLIASITVLSLAAERLEHRYLSAVLLSLGTLIKIEPFFFLIYFVIFRRDLKYLVGYVISCMTIVAVSLIVVPIQWYFYYFANIVPTLYSQYTMDNDQSIVRFLWYAGLTKPELQVVSAIGVGLLAVFAFYVSNKRIKSAEEKALLTDAMFVLNVLVLLFFSPRALIYPYCWVVLPSSYFLSGLLMHQRVRGAYLAAVGFAIFLMNSQPTGYEGWFLDVYRVDMRVPTNLIGNAILIVCLLVLCVRTIIPSIVSVVPLVRKK